MYDGLTPLFGSVAPSDLTTYFKSEKFGLAGLPLVRTETPRSGLTIKRDSFDVPHLYAKTRDELTWGAGYVAGEDRHLLINEARGDARIAAIDAPGLSAFGLVTSLKTFVPSAQTEAYVARQTNVLQHAGPKGLQALHDIDMYVAGVNAWYADHGGVPNPPVGRNDVYAVNALAGQLFGRGGGAEIRSSMLLNALQTRLGAKRGFTLWNDLRSRNDPETPVTADGRFPYDRGPKSRSGNVIIDNGSFNAVPVPTLAKAAAPPVGPAHASNFLLVSGRKSKTHHPIAVMGPQIGYFYPGLTLEMDMHGPGVASRGVTAPGFPGYMLIGRGPDYAWSLTSAGSDVIDEYAETLCGGSDLKYMYKGRCRNMGFFDAGYINGTPHQEVTFHTTVHGPVLGYATTQGRRVALTFKRSSRGKDVLWQLPFQDLTLGRVHDAKQFQRSMQQSPFTFNAGYVDDRHTAMYTTGLLPIRPPDAGGDIPTNGDGNHEWRGFAPPRLHPKAIDSHSGFLVNWNNKPALGFPGADDQFSYGPLFRVLMLRNNLLAKLRQGGGTVGPAGVVGAMNQAATEDFRDVFVIPWVARVLNTGPAPNARDQQMLALLLNWRKLGASRLDRNLDGKIDDPGAAIMDAFSPLMADAVMDPVLGPQAAQLSSSLLGKDAGSAADFEGGWSAYVQKDLRNLLGQPVRGKYHSHFCGLGNLASCRAALWNAMDAAGNALQAAQGANPATWRASATAERISFKPGLLSTTIRFTNRPSGIQQVIWFNGHR
jgi:Penicillin amidase